MFLKNACENGQHLESGLSGLACSSGLSLRSLLFLCCFVLDINECEEDTHSCPKFSRCKNKNGGYDCPCKDGFQKDAQGTCSGNTSFYTSSFFLFFLLL